MGEQLSIPYPGARLRAVSNEVWMQMSSDRRPARARWQESLQAHLKTSAMPEDIYCFRVNP